CEYSVTTASDDASKRIIVGTDRDCPAAMSTLNCWKALRMPPPRSALLPNLTRGVFALLPMLTTGALKKPDSNNDRIWLRRRVMKS
ncbi:MAG: hypothetical protein PVJ86_04230, partial [Phycisphaerales bacterium]